MNDIQITCNLLFCFVSQKHYSKKIIIKWKSIHYIQHFFLVKIISTFGKLSPELGKAWPPAKS